LKGVDKLKDNKPTMLTVREIAKKGILPEHAIRLLLKDGVYANLKLGQLAHRKLGQYQYN
jgi:hypothetical protein